MIGRLNLLLVILVAACVLGEVGLMISDQGAEPVQVQGDASHG